MRKKKVIFKQRLSYIFSLLLIATFVISCSLFNSGPNISSFTIEVDSLNVPSKVTSSDTLIIRPLGTVGPNGCYSFDRFKASRTSSTIELKLIGKLVEDDDTACTNALVKLNTTYKVAPPLEGPFEINIRQPDQSILSRTVEVNDQ